MFEEVRLLQMKVTVIAACLDLKRFVLYRVSQDK